jgi:hypothetical protein
MEHQKVSSAPSIRGEELIEDESEGNKGVVLLLIPTTNPIYFLDVVTQPETFASFLFLFFLGGDPLKLLILLSSSSKRYPPPHRRPALTSRPSPVPSSAYVMRSVYNPVAGSLLTSIRILENI